MQRLIFALVLLTLSACTTAPKRDEPEQKPQPPVAAQVKCLDCGVVHDIRVVTSSPDTATPKKPVLSGIVGGVVSKPSTSKPTSHYEIQIQMLNGKRVLVTQSILSTGLRIGSKVRVSQGRILAVSP